MMYIQVKDIDKKFSELEDLKKNNWIEKQVDIKKVVKKRSSAKKAVSGSKMSTNKTDESRNKFREMRTRMKAKIDAERRDEENAFKIILTPVKNKAAIGSNEPETILTPVRRSTRKPRNDINAADPLRNLPANVSVDLFGSTSKTGQRIIKNEYLTNFDDSVFGGLSSPVPHSVEEDLMIFSPKTTGNTNMKAVDESNASVYL
ncbi:uncharacterized protein LOC124440750 [Xenia sp. Carnegie-2017]|uniref:uncharacterized protein LOC124440750 n=1 Tax=Xenia sp. Carnegie-2017 TaxID=2897299 RepID=UPI001F0331D0|nr:uncharacterized protein LOC124440750 [Xenia sp. Carnegie-2017]